jgi:hypothetical protein
MQQETTTSIGFNSLYYASIGLAASAGYFVMKPKTVDADSYYNKV